MFWAWCFVCFLFGGLEVFLDKASVCITQDGIKVKVHLPLPPKCCHCRHTLSHVALIIFLHVNYPYKWSFMYSASLWLGARKIEHTENIQWKTLGFAFWVSLWSEHGIIDHRIGAVRNSEWESQAESHVPILGLSLCLVQETSNSCSGQTRGLLGNRTEEEREWVFPLHDYSTLCTVCYICYVTSNNSDLEVK